MVLDGNSEKHRSACLRLQSGFCIFTAEHTPSTLLTPEKIGTNVFVHLCTVFSRIRDSTALSVQYNTTRTTVTWERGNAFQSLNLIKRSPSYSNVIIKQMSFKRSNRTWEFEYGRQLIPWIWVLRLLLPRSLHHPVFKTLWASHWHQSYPLAQHICASSQDKPISFKSCLTVSSHVFLCLPLGVAEFCYSAHAEFCAELATCAELAVLHSTQRYQSITEIVKFCSFCLAILLLIRHWQLPQPEQNISV